MSAVDMSYRNPNDHRSALFVLEPQGEDRAPAALRSKRRPVSGLLARVRDDDVIVGAVLQAQPLAASLYA